MSRAHAVRDYGRSLAVSDPILDETLQNSCQPQLSTITCNSTAPYVGAGSSSGASSTSTGGVWAERRWDRIERSKDFIRARLAVEDEDDEREVRREFEAMELERVEAGEEEHEVHPGRSRNPFIEDVCCVEERPR